MHINCEKKYLEIYWGAAEHSLGIAVLSNVALRLRFLLKTSASVKVSTCVGYSGVGHGVEHVCTLVNITDYTNTAHFLRCWSWETWIRV